MFLCFFQPKNIAKTVKNKVLARQARKKAKNYDYFDPKHWFKKNIGVKVLLFLVDVLIKSRQWYILLSQKIRPCVPVVSVPVTQALIKFLIGYTFRSPHKMFSARIILVSLPNQCCLACTKIAWIVSSPSAMQASRRCKPSTRTRRVPS